MRFDTANLFHKWGNGDGDMLDDLLESNLTPNEWARISACSDDLDEPDPIHKVLFDVIVEYVVPRTRE